MDFEGNWKWGKFVYNVSFAMTSMSGCHLDAANNMVVLGVGDSVPVIMEMNLVDGSVTKFLNLDLSGSGASSQSWYKTFGGIYHDISTIPGERSYYYMSFVIDDKMQVLKIDDEAD